MTIVRNQQLKQPARSVYLDYAAATDLDPRVKRAMEPFWSDRFGNPSSLSGLGRQAKVALEAARKSIGHILNVQPAELIFTGSGTESANLAIFGVCKAWQATQSGAADRKKAHFITSQIEHQAVFRPFQVLEKAGHQVSYLPVDQDGLVDPASVEQAIRPNTLLVSIMYANNEIGSIQPIEAIAKICRRHDILLHTDACQAAGALSLDVKRLGVDLLTLNGGKIYGPKGVGLLYVRQGVSIQPLIYGGGQEKGLRSGTENMPAIVGFAKALELVESTKTAENARLIKLRQFFIGEVLKRVPGARLNGHPTRRLPNNINIAFSGLDGESLLLLLDQAGIACATGSACDSAALEPSHVLLALGLDPDQAKASIRFTLGRKTSKTDLEYVVKALVKAVAELQAIAPVLPH